MTTSTKTNARTHPITSTRLLLTHQSYLLKHLHPSTLASVSQAKSLIMFSDGSLALLLQWPSEFQANISLCDQQLFSSYERTTTHLCLKYSCRKTLMLRTSPEATTQAHLMFVTINSAKIQWGCSTPTDGSNHP